MSCPLGNQTNTFNPPLGIVTQQVSLDAVGSNTQCTPNPYDIQGGTWHATGTGRLNCLTGGSTSGTITWTWNTGDVTVATYPTFGITLRPLGQTIVVVLGDVISGPFEGGTMVFTSTLLELDLLACLNGSVESVGGPMAVTFEDI